MCVEMEKVVLPEKIRRIREGLGLSRYQFAKYLHVTPQTVHDWEVKGESKKMTNSIKELLRLKCSSEYLQVNEDEIKRIKKTLATEETGYRFFSEIFFRNILLFLIKRVKTSKLFLNKILFYIDFYHFKQNDCSITGSKYVPLQYGPCPDRFQNHFQRYIRQGILIPLNHYKFDSPHEPDMNIFSEEEAKSINDVFQLCKRDGGKNLYDLSHREDGFLQTKLCQPISYEKFAPRIKI